MNPLLVSLALAFGTQVPAGSKWPFNPPIDTFSPTSLLDLRSLNEAVAGQSGFVKVDPKRGFLLGNGTPERFWSVTDYVQNLPDAADLAHHARWLAKRGVNMVRFHGQISPKDANDSLTQPNSDEIDHCWKLVGAMKKEGIYTTISPYWAGPVGKKYLGWAVDDNGGNDAWGLLFFDPKLQEGYRAWMRKLFASKNPYTGIPLSQDPAVAIIQLQNEDSLLFWTSQNIKGKQRENLETLFGKWVTAMFGDSKVAPPKWQGVSASGDDFARGRVGLLDTWVLTQPQTGGMAARVASQVEFYADTMHAFNLKMKTFLRQDLGCKQLINDGNWRTADQPKLLDAERWSYTAGDVIGLNKYFTGLHIGPDNGWAIRPNDFFTNSSATLDPRALPINVKQVEGHPTIISESEWVYPNLYQSEGPFLTAAYESLTGVDSLFFFAVGDVPEWHPPYQAVGSWVPPLGKWSVNTPMQLGQFPAAALAYRTFAIKKGSPVVQEGRTLQDLWNRRDPLIAEDSPYDPNRDTGVSGSQSQAGTVDPLAFLVGPVTVRYSQISSPSTVSDLSSFIDHERRRVTSNTREITLDYQTGLCTLNAAAIQGACGFLSKAGPISLRDVDLSSGNDYASVMVTSMDGQPIRSSSKLLVQVGTTARPNRWQDTPATHVGDDKKPVAGFKVVATGSNPWQIAATDVELTVRNPGLRRATLLDVNGVPVRDVKLVSNGAAIKLRLPPETIYLVLRR